MSANKTKVLNLLEMRFDYQSARNVLANWRKAAGIKDDMDFMNDDQLRCLLGYLKANAADANRVHDAIERLILSDAAPVEAAPVVEVAAPVEEVAEVTEVAAPVEEIAEVAEVAEVEAAPAEENAEAAPAEENAEAADDDAPAESGKKKKKSKK